MNILWKKGLAKVILKQETLRSLYTRIIRRTERIVLNAFDKEGGEITNVDGVKFKVKTVTDKILMEALCIPKSSTQLSSNQNSQYVLSQSYPHLQGLNIVNGSSKTTFDVDLLVGLYFTIILSLVTLRKVKLENQ